MERKREQQADESANERLSEVDAEREREGISLEPGFTNQPLETNEMETIDPDEPDDDEPVEPEPVYFPPTDPVITSNAQGDIEVLGGFAASSMDNMGVERSTEDEQLGDEALADAVRRELREDALTTDLPIDVGVEEGIVHLYGTVEELEDAENAEEVASRVPGVIEVIDELEIADM
jgi:hypothetical protein